MVNWVICLCCRSLYTKYIHLYYINMCTPLYTSLVLKCMDLACVAAANVTSGVGVTVIATAGTIRTTTLGA